VKSIFRARPEAEELRNRTAGWGQVWVWLPPVLMMIVIACESTNTFSAENTSGWLRPIFERIFGHVSDQFWGVLHFWARKSGHLTGYGILCLTWLRAWLLTLGRKAGLAVWKWRLQSSALALVCTFCVGGLDEWHQTFIPSRTGLFSDVLIDTLGGFLACLVVAILFWVRPRRRGGKAAALAVGD
jgi:VanZ family protein